MRKVLFNTVQNHLKQSLCTVTVLTHLLQCIGIPGAGVQDVNPKGHAGQQNVVHIDSVYGEQHGLQPLDPSVLIHATTLLHPRTFFVHGEQSAENQVALNADLSAGWRWVSDKGEDAPTHHDQE